jgi:hypothetical protein
MARPISTLAVCLLLLGVCAPTRAQEEPATRAGDWDAPFLVKAFPFVHAASTVGRRSVAARYRLRADLDESGPEVVYRLDVPSSGTLVAWVQGDRTPVDVDVHILSSLALDDGEATGCLARGNRVCEARVTAGLAYVAVDTFGGADRAGPYRLRLDFQPDDGWYERPLARGVTLRTRPYSDLFGARQTASVLHVDPGARGVSVRPIGGGRCAVTSRHAREAGAVAAVNGGFFGDGCRSVSLLKVDGQTLATNTKSRTALGFGEDWIRMRLVAAGEDWSEARHALGGVPRLLDAGEVVVEPGAEGSGRSFATARHPRTAVGLTAAGALIMATVDGRTSAGAGMSLVELAGWLQELGCQDALNLDGGGSTTLWVADAPYDGVVNYPSGDRQATHAGERQVASALGVWAEPLDLDPVWLTAPPAAQVDPGELWVYELAAADPEAAPVALSVVEPAPPGFELVDRGDGTARCSWRVAQGPRTVRLRARAGGGSVEQEVPLPRP